MGSVLSVDLRISRLGRGCSCFAYCSALRSLDRPAAGARARRRKEAEGRAYEERAGARDVRRDWRRQPGALATLFRVADLQQDLYEQRIM